MSSYAVWRDTKCVTVMSTEFPGHSERTVLRTMKSNNDKFEEKNPF